MPAETINSLVSSEKKIKGLSTSEAEQLLEEHGPNALPESPPPSDLSVFLSQLKSPLVYILLVAGVVTFFLHEYADTAIITFAVFLNTILGFLQERKAGQALAALKKLVHPHAQVFRDGELVTIEVEKLVPGDLVLLNQGDKIPTDGKLVDANRFFVSEAILTGESESISKTLDNEVYMGTIVTAGRAKMVVEVTGAQTEMGKIAVSISDSEQEDTPLGKQLNKFGKQLSILVLGLIVTVFIVGMFMGEDIVEIFTTAVALSVSAIPEGLLVGLTVVLAIGMQRILARKGLVRNLVSAETLGGVTTICVDKTGTLTEGKMQVVNVIGEEHELVRQVTLANDLDTSTVIAAWEWGSDKISDDEKQKMSIHERLDSLPFTSENKFSASLYPSDDNNVLFVTGAPDIVLEYTNLSEGEKEKIRSKIKDFAEKGKRTLAFARKEMPLSKKRLSDDDIKEGLNWVGMLAFTDPVRKDVKDALKKTRKAGIKLIVITGDYAETARSVLRELELDVAEKDIILGEDLERLSGRELEKRIFRDEGSIKLFARTRPHQKLKIVETLKAHGEVVAMMGDGVNDAPALSRADIGVVVGEASDVAKESADLVLLDSSFSTIVAAIEEGRGLFDNLRKIILYLMIDAFEGILVVLSSIILRLPLPITAIHILWINLLSDGFPHLALTVDPKAPGLMERGPRSPKEPLITGWMSWLIAIVSLSGWVFALGSFIYVLRTTGDLTMARSVAFATIGVNSLIYVFSVRTLTDPFWNADPLENKWLLLAVGVGLVFQVFPFATEATRAFFKITSIGYYWVMVFGAAFLMFFVIEVFKWVFRHRMAGRVN
ncbi:HAD-IC family P-type ATPase [candidate division WWE3 bacterium]|jgi:P-type Ca2+ transporter type 2C|nr:HAD-IC family P-type ATPase [candidate division WWE3 bacterium]MBT7350202.1 HAD-IC family P-type ATPase [candidate division WWE3 bacterium]